MPKGALDDERGLISQREQQDLHSYSGGDTSFSLLHFWHFLVSGHVCVLLCNLLFFHCLSITQMIALAALRGYSTVWRNDKDVVVKRVWYHDPSDRFASKRGNEAQLMDHLPIGWEYELTALSDSHVSLQRTKRLIPEPNTRSPAPPTEERGW